MYSVVLHCEPPNLSALPLLVPVLGHSIDLSYLVVVLILALSLVLVLVLIPSLILGLNFLAEEDTGYPRYSISKCGDDDFFSHWTICS